MTVKLTKKAEVILAKNGFSTESFRKILPMVNEIDKHAKKYDKLRKQINFGFKVPRHIVQKSHIYESEGPFGKEEPFVITSTTYYKEGEEANEQKKQMRKEVEAIFKQVKEMEEALGNNRNFSYLPKPELY